MHGAAIVSRPAYRRSRLRALLLALPLLMSGPVAHALDLQGHRGARGLLPENTLAGFDRALALGATTLEMDLAVTADGETIWTGDMGSNTVTELSAGRGTRVRSLPAPAQPEAVNVAPDGGRVFAGSNATGRVTAWDTGSGEATPDGHGAETKGKGRMAHRRRGRFKIEYGVPIARQWVQHRPIAEGRHRVIGA